MKLPQLPPLEPMEASTAAAVPQGGVWQFEPKWDGFRCLAFRDGSEVVLQSKGGKPLTRYFPEVAELLGALKARRFVLDGELVIVTAQGNSAFDMLLQRIHPAASRVARLARENPARYVVFDILVDEQGRDLTGLPLKQRRRALQRFAAKYFVRGIVLSPLLKTRQDALRVLVARRRALDGIVAKRTDMPYRSASRDAMVKVKHRRSVDCVIGGFRHAPNGARIGALLLGLYDDTGVLHYVGHCTVPAGKHDRLLTRISEHAAGTSFSGRKPGAQSRWSGAETRAWHAVEPLYVVEVQYDQVTSNRFRHGTKMLRERPDKRPEQCTFAQLQPSGAGTGRLLAE